MSFLWCPHCKQPHALSTSSCPTTGLRIEMGIGRAERALSERGAYVGKHYKVKALVGAESVAFVYVAKHVTTGRLVLVKVVHADDAPLEERVAEVLEMEREAKAASMVEHPNVAPVLDFEGSARGEGFLVREHSTSTLAHALRANGALDPADATDLLLQILSGLHAIDLMGIVHRDLATHNIFVQQREGCRPFVRIGGLGRSSGPSLGVTKDPPSGMHYAAPELVADPPGIVDHRSDLFSCGVMLFEMLTGRRPFEAATTTAVRTALLHDAPPSAAQLAPHLGDEWLEVLDRALAKDPSRRFQTARELQRALPSHSRRTARLRFPSEAAEHIGLTETVPFSEGPRSRSGALGSRCDPYIGRVLGGGYALETLLGTGTAGAVYKAMHMRLHRPVAVKILHDRHRTSKQYVERFKAEALLACKLDHPNVTRILDCGEESDGRLYLVMEYVEGRSLAAVLAEEGPLSQTRAVTIAVQLLSSLVVAHAAGIVHRDMKPENVLLLIAPEDDGDTSAAVVAKVCDFGIAKLHRDEVEGDGGAEDSSGDSSGLTTAGLLLGSPAYMAPEQVRAEECDARADIYAVGVTLFEMLTGRFPHEADTLIDLFTKKLKEAPTRPSTFSDDVDPLLEDIIMRALEPMPERRHATAFDMRTELVEALRLFRPAPPSSEQTVSIWPEGRDR